MSRRLVVWEAHHDNGWTTSVSEQSGGVFLLHVGRDGADGFSCEARSMGQAQGAALAALERTTGHRQCSPECSGWLLRLEPAEQHRARE
jgi:hypothetical protein